MNDSQLIERLAATDLYSEEASLPETMRADIVLLDIARRMEMDTLERTQVEAVKPPRPRWNGPLIAAAAFALVIVIGVAALLLTNQNDGTDPANPGTTEAPTTEVPAIETSQGAAALIGRNWTVVGGISFSRPNSIEFDADGNYRVFDGLQVAAGQSTTDGEVITFEAAPTDEVGWVRNEVFLRSTNSCEGVVGQYRVVFTGTEQATLEVISDGCPPRVGVANGLVLEPAKP
jgi:hypothetical protein